MKKKSHVWGEYQTPSPGTPLSNSLKIELCAPLKLISVEIRLSEHDTSHLFKHSLVFPPLLLPGTEVNECGRHMEQTPGFDMLYVCHWHVPYVRHTW